MFFEVFVEVFFDCVFVWVCLGCLVLILFDVFVVLDFFG